MSLSLDSYAPSVRRVLWLTLFVNLGVVAVKLMLGLRASSLSVLSDAAHSSSDALNNVMGLLIMSAVRPYADAEHPYGHTKFEVVGAMGIAAFMLIAVYEIVSHAVERLFTDGAQPEVTLVTVLVFALTIVGNLLVIWYERAEGKRLGSQFLLADARHTQSDLYVTIGVIGGLALTALGFPVMDTVLSLFVGVLVAYTGYRVVRDALPVLVDQAVHTPDEVRQVAEAVPGVRTAEQVRTRGAGPHCFIELAVRTEEPSLHGAHRIADNVERALHDRFGPDCTVTVHMEPSEENGA